MKVAVVGSSGSGKSTVARILAAQLAVPYVELDALHWGPNWAECPEEEFRARVEVATAGDGWVVDGNYYRKLGDLVLARADLVVWLDLPLSTSLRRVWSRTLRRIREQTELWGGNRETWRDAFFSRDSLFVWILRTRRRQRRRYLDRLAKYDMVRLRSERDIEAWLAGSSPQASEAAGSG
jgi:adenylate kinase family enzyme